MHKRARPLLPLRSLLRLPQVRGCRLRLRPPSEAVNRLRQRHPEEVAAAEQELAALRRGGGRAPAQAHAASGGNAAPLNTARTAGPAGVAPPQGHAGDRGAAPPARPAEPVVATERDHEQEPCLLPVVVHHINMGNLPPRQEIKLTSKQIFITGLPQPRHLGGRRVDVEAELRRAIERAGGAGAVRARAHAAPRRAREAPEGRCGCRAAASCGGRRWARDPCPTQLAHPHACHAVSDLRIKPGDSRGDVAYACLATAQQAVRVIGELQGMEVRWPGG